MTLAESRAVQPNPSRAALAGPTRSSPLKARQRGPWAASKDWISCTREAEESISGSIRKNNLEYM